uniref:Uncharacterized protein n=1 Tax=Myoviridae sp. ctAys2 TaxID=2825044 RepID=A0A8S5Q4E6_9CAUD|nr:MAG TPA: hypothetical protein [Myoviridae sp. ctAys2]
MHNHKTSSNYLVLFSLWVNCGYALIFPSLYATLLLVAKPIKTRS